MKTILITGASSGLGAALAMEYAAPAVTLYLGGRNAVRLQDVAELAEKKGATVHIKTIDVTDRAAMAAWIAQADSDPQGPLDLVIANAGISAGTGKGEESDDQCAAIFATNVQGVLNTVQPAAALMKKRKRGQIAIMSSLAGFRGIAGAPAYCASKAAVRVYGEALRGDLAAHGVQVNVICPGFVKTPMTDVNDFAMPFVMGADRAARIMKDGLEKNKARIAYPWPMAALVWLIASLPIAWTDALFARMPRKP